MPKQFAYAQITEWLREEVLRRGPGALMPTINEVGERFGVGGVQTVRDGYAPLVEEGLVERLDSPRRWAVVDRGQGTSPRPDTLDTVKRLEELLAEATLLVGDLRRAV